MKVVSIGSSGTADVGDDVDDPNKSTLPILKRLQARKDHLEELRGELRAFTFVNGDGEPARSSSSSGVATRVRQFFSLSLSIFSRIWNLGHLPLPEPSL